MKNAIIIIGLMLVVSLAISGCANQQVQEKPTPEVTKEEPTVVPIVEETPEEILAEEVPEETPVEEVPEVEPVVETPTEETPEEEPRTVTSVSQEELDKLKEDIEKLEAEDLGGLSE